MKAIMVLLVVCFTVSSFSQSLYDTECMFDSESDPQKTLASTASFDPVNLTGDYEDLVIFVGFPDRVNTQSWSTLQSIVWDGTNSHGEHVSSGIYLYKIKIVSNENNKIFEQSGKLMMLK